MKITNCHTDEDVQKLGETDAYMTLVASTIMGAFVRNSQGHRTYIYEFACDIPGEDNPGAYHGAELAFAYDALARCGDRSLENPMIWHDILILTG